MVLDIASYCNPKPLEGIKGYREEIVWPAG
jgi:hypothetical protein